MDQSHRIWQSNGSAAHAARSWNRRVGPIALPDRPSQTDALGPCWLFLQRNNSQTPQLLYKYEDRYPMLGILAGRSLPRPMLSPVPPVLAGADQARPP